MPVEGNIPQSKSFFFDLAMKIDDEKVHGVIYATQSDGGKTFSNRFSLAPFVILWGKRMTNPLFHSIKRLISGIKRKKMFFLSSQLLPLWDFVEQILQKLRTERRFKLFHFFNEKSS